MKLKIVVFFCFLFSSIVSLPQSYSDIVLSNSNVLRVDCLNDQIFRLRISVDGRFPLSSMEKYGIVRHSWPGSGEMKTEKKAGKLIFSTPKAKLSVDTKNGIFSLFKPNGEVALESAYLKKQEYGGDFGVTFDLQDNELFYGLGDVDREQIQRRGHVMRAWVSYGPAYAPVPFIMSSNGWAVFVNTTYKHYYDVGKTNPDKMRIWGEKGLLDLYLISGDDYQNLLFQYTEVTGKPRLMPQKAYGLTFQDNREINQFELIDLALKFREKCIPCDYLELGPGWMETFRDLSVKQDWDFKDFFMPAWFGDRFRQKELSEITFVGGLKRLGYKLGLWTLCEYDLTYEAERQARENFPELYDKKEEKPFLPVDESNFDLRAHQPKYFNQYTLKNEPWFEHFKKLLNDGVRSFMQDPAYIINEHPDWHYGNGMDDDQMHNLYQPMYQKQMYEGWKDLLNERPMFYFCTGYAGVQRWAPTWTGDDGGRKRPLAAMLNLGMTAHSNVTCDMDIFSADGIHFGFLQGWSRVNGWWSISHPWVLGDDLFQTFKYYARLRYRLMPYIYSYAHISHQTAVPIMRAMPLMYPKDKKCAELTKQYMFGDYFLVSAFTDNIYLPEGKWIDYWSGKEYDGKQEIKLDIPKSKGGGLFVKAGAIIPEWPYVDYVGQKEIDTITVQVYPYLKSSFTLIEDSGEGFGYEIGQIAETKMVCDASDKEITFTKFKRTGTYEGMPENRTFQFIFHLPRKPLLILVGGKEFRDWRYDYDKRLLTIFDFSQIEDKAWKIIY